MKRTSTGIFPIFLAALTVLMASCEGVRQSEEGPPPSASPPDRTTEKKEPRLLQGPMLGFASDREARIWVRLNGPYRVRVRYAPEAEEEAAQGKTTRAARAHLGRDHTAVIRLTDLEPDTAYRYTVLIEGVETAEPAKPGKMRVFRTLPAADLPGKFRVAFGSCASVDFDPIQPIWKAVARTRPHAFLWLGDNIYADSQDPDILREKYRSQRRVKNLLDFQAAVPQLAIWDDHDYGVNDGDRTSPAKEESLAVFREYWANPQYGLRGTPGLPEMVGLPQRPGVPQTPGVFFRWSIGDVDFFLLDSRMYRDPNQLPDGPEKTHLGIWQKQWLKAELTRSRAVFKVLVAPGAWTEGKGPGGDTWASFLQERNEIFDFIRDQDVTGVFLLAGDSHRPQINVIPWSKGGGYDLYEVISSPLAQEVDREPLGTGNFLRLRPPNAYTLNFGLLEFDTQARPARVTIRLIDPAGKDLWTPLVLTADDLWPGVKSWEKKTAARPSGS